MAVLHQLYEEVQVHTDTHSRTIRQQFSECDHWTSINSAIRKLVRDADCWVSSQIYGIKIFMGGVPRG